MKIRVLQEVRSPIPGSGPLLPGISSEFKLAGPCPRDSRKFAIQIGVITLASDQYEIVPEPHPFSPEGWQTILDKLPKWERNPNRKAFPGVAIDPLRNPQGAQ